MLVWRGRGRVVLNCFSHCILGELITRTPRYQVSKGGSK